MRGIGAWGGTAHRALVGLPQHLHLVMEVGLVGQTGIWGQAWAVGQCVPSLWMLAAAVPQLEQVPCLFLL